MIDFPIDDLLDEAACLTWIEKYLHPQELRCPQGSGATERRAGSDDQTWKATRQLNTRTGKVAIIHHNNGRTISAISPSKINIVHKTLHSIQGTSSSRNRIDAPEKLLARLSYSMVKVGLETAMSLDSS